MIRVVFSGLAGAWIARIVERGDIPERFAVPLVFLATRIPTPVILAGAIGYGIYRWDQEARAARNVPPWPAASRKKKPATRPKRPKPATSNRTANAAQ